MTENKEEKEVSISMLPVSKMGIQKVVIIPKSLEKIQPKDRVIVIKVTPEILEFFKEFVLKKKVEIVDYMCRRRFC